MRFWKYHGLGNDFILMDGVNEGLDVDPAWCKSACDRNFGIGGDGVLYVLPGKGSDICMRIINADGSEAEMCGNGIRCVAKHAFDNGMVSKEEFTVWTMAGVLTAKVHLDAGKVNAVSIGMGAPVLDGRQVPIDHDGRFIAQPLEVDGISIVGNAVSMGNPHFITFDDITDENVRMLGPRLESHAFFPRRTNVEFCRVRDGRIYVKVYERGAAWTLACGTGACASTVAAALNGLVEFDRPIEVSLPGGWLTITVDGDLRAVTMKGPAELVYRGEI